MQPDKTICPIFEKSQKASKQTKLMVSHRPSLRAFSCASITSWFFRITLLCLNKDEDTKPVDCAPTDRRVCTVVVDLFQRLREHVVPLAICRRNCTLRALRFRMHLASERECARSLGLSEESECSFQWLVPSPIVHLAQARGKRNNRPTNDPVEAAFNSHSTETISVGSSAVPPSRLSAFPRSKVYITYMQCLVA